jgi:hypothetical protein
MIFTMSAWASALTILTSCFPFMLTHWVLFTLDCGGIINLTNNGSQLIQMTSYSIGKQCTWLVKVYVDSKLEIAKLLLSILSMRENEVQRCRRSIQYLARWYTAPFPLISFKRIILVTHTPILIRCKISPNGLYKQYPVWNYNNLYSFIWNLIQK